MVSGLACLDLLLGRDASVQKWKKIFLAIFQGKLDEGQIKRLLLLLAKRGEGASEIMGCLEAVRRLEPPRRVAVPFLVDVCGTGGDGRHTFNISTVSSFVIAGAGGSVAKHGNRAVSSRAGSSDLMEALGVRLDVPFPRMRRALEECRLGYFHAPIYHPTFSRVQAVRRKLGIRTLFNLMGPLVNPLELDYQIMGVARREWLEPLANVMRSLGRRKAAVFRSEDGLDELSTRAPSDILYLEGPRLRRMRLDPSRLGFSKAKEADYAGGDIRANREIAVGILQGRLKGPRLEIVLLNSGFVLWLVGIASNLEEGVERSGWVIRSGRAMQVLEALRRITNARVGT